MRKDYKIRRFKYGLIKRWENCNLVRGLKNGLNL
jgi:hypothetical protein